VQAGVCLCLFLAVFVVFSLGGGSFSSHGILQ
jgi:hypothetical protein